MLGLSPFQLAKHCLGRVILIPRLRASVVSAILGATFVVLAPSIAMAVVSVLDSPALMSPLVSSSFLTAVTRAGTRLVAVGERGHIIISDDNGLNWSQAEVPVSVTLTAVQFVNSQIGWAVGHGGIILRSLDGGASWKKQLDGRALAKLIEIYAVDKGEAAGRLARRWSADGPDKPLLALYFRDASNGIVVGAYGILLETSDGGAHWLPRLDQVEDPDRRHINAIRATKSAIYMAGEQGTLYRRDGAEGQFRRLPSPYKGSFFDLLISPRGTLLALGLRGNLFRSETEGKTWERIDLGSKNTLTQGTVLQDGSLVLADEDGSTWLSHDDGRSFRKFRDPNAFPYASLVQAANGHLVAVGVRGYKAIDPH